MRSERQSLVVPDDAVMVETDAPYLAPSPTVASATSRVFVVRTLEVLARIRGLEPDRLGAQIAANAARLFRLPPN